MNGDSRPRWGRSRRGRRREPACDGIGPGRGRRLEGSRGRESSLAGRTAGRALLALGAYVAQDLRDAEGLTRPMLRRGALRVSLGRRESLRRLAGAYLRLDPPAPDELPQRGDTIDVGRHLSRALPEARSAGKDTPDRHRPAC